MRGEYNALPEGWTPSSEYLMPGWRYDAVMAWISGYEHAQKTVNGGGDPNNKTFHRGRTADEIISEHVAFSMEGCGYGDVETAVRRHARWWLAKAGKPMARAERTVIARLHRQGWTHVAIGAHLGRDPLSVGRRVREAA